MGPPSTHLVYGQTTLKRSARINMKLRIISIFMLHISKYLVKGNLECDQVKKNELNSKQDAQ